MTEWKALFEASDLLRCFQEVAEKSVRLRIASAFVSPFGPQRVLRLHVPKDATIVVGRDLSKSQLEGLKQLRENCNVRVWIGRAPFHPKVYLLETPDFARVIIGSSNFTGGGFATNIEVNLFADLPLTHELLDSLRGRFEHWALESTPLTEEWVAALDEAATVAELAQGLVEGDQQSARARARIEQLIGEERQRRLEAEEAARARALAARPFFRPEHFSAFAVPKQRSDSPGVVQERKAVSQRFLDLHQDLLPRIEGARWDLHAHHKAQNTTSSWHLVPDIVPEISAMWLSYGRSHERFKELNDREADDVQGFFNHTKLQVLIDERCLRLGLMIAQRNNEWDRDYLKKKLGLIASPVVVEPDRVLELLRTAGTAEPAAYLERESHADREDRERILLRDLDRDSLRSMVSRDQRGHWFGAWLDLVPSEPAVSEERILDTTVRVFGLLYPAYELLAWYPRKR